MTASWIDNARDDLYLDEGSRSKPYKDTRGFLTIGVGHNLSAAGLCPAAIRAQFDFDFAGVVEDLNRRIPWWVDQPEVVKRVLVNLTFNMGIQKVLGFHQMLLAMQLGDYPLAASHLLQSAYASQVPNRAKRLAALLASVI